MTWWKAIAQLESLIDDRKSLCYGDEELDDVFLRDIDALKYAIESIKKENVNEQTGQQEHRISAESA